MPFLAGLQVYHVFLIDTDSDTLNQTPAVEYVACPTEETFNQLWNQWSYEYINQNPYATIDDQMGAWNALMFQNGCGPEWYNPLSDLIEQQGASGTQVYWYTE